MDFKVLYDSWSKKAAHYFKLAIHPRRLIIASEKKVTQFTIGVPLQLFVIALLAGGVLWSSYATGRFIAAKSTLKAQKQTIRSVIAERVSDNLSPLRTTATKIEEKTPYIADKNSFFKFDASNTRLMMLEKEVAELKTANEAIIERVREKTDGQLENLESIVKKTGLGSDYLQKQVDMQTDRYEKRQEAEGGPYIPSDMPGISEDASQMLASLDKLKAMREIIAGLPLGMPIKNADEHSNFGRRIDPFNGTVAFHAGLDLAADSGAHIYSAADGTVVNAGREGAYGNMVEINHGFGITTRYGHLSKITVREGDKIKKGEEIGVQGSTGRSTGEHLHYEVRKNGTAINPEQFLQTGRLLELGNAISQN